MKGRVGSRRPRRPSVWTFGRVGPDFDAFVRDSSTDLLRLATLLTRDRLDAEDVVQVALVRVAGRWSAARRDPMPYARRVVVNLTKNRWRDRSRRPREVMTGDHVDTLVESDVEALGERDAVGRLIADLPHGQRAVLVLRFFEDLPVAEVAALLGCSEGTVKSQTSRALAALRAALAPATRSTGKDDDND